MSNTHITGQGTHIPGAKNITNQTWPLVHMKGITFRSRNPGSILTTMLKDHQAIV
jgi:hypothetical protein